VRNLFARFAIGPIYAWYGEAFRLGVNPLKLVFETNLGLAQVAQQPAFFDFPRLLPPHFHFTAPWHAAERDDEVPFPWEWLDGRPLVYASMGTLQNNLPRAMQAIVESARGLDVQLVLTQGGCAEPLKLAAPPPSNVKIVSKAPQLRLLDRAAIAITHAGLNTALECIARAVPMICIPITNDQPGVARRVEWLGMGEFLSLEQLAPGSLRATIQRMLADPRYRQTCLVRREEIAQIDGPDLAARIALAAFKASPRKLTPADFLAQSSPPAPFLPSTS
jgi:MGT family glycosyltransferase